MGSHARERAAAGSSAGRIAWAAGILRGRLLVVQRGQEAVAVGSNVGRSARGNDLERDAAGLHERRQPGPRDNLVHASGQWLQGDEQIQGVWQWQRVVPKLTLRSAGQRHGEQQPAGIDIAECYFGQFAVCFNMLDICRFDASLTCLLGGSGPIHLDLFICSLGINLVLCR
jgi:hypothetical protein